MSRKAGSISSNYVLSKECVLEEKEIECLSLIALGYTNEEIAKIFFISLGTAKIRVKNILKNLSAVDRTHAVTMGFLHQIINISVINSVIEKYHLKPGHIERLG